MTDFRALCAELLDWAEVTAAHCIQLSDVLLRARAALADEPPEPAPPADGEVAELVEWLKENAEDERQMSGGDNPASLKLDRAAELLQRPMADLSPTAYALLTLAAELES